MKKDPKRENVSESRHLTILMEDFIEFAEGRVAVKRMTKMFKSESTPIMPSFSQQERGTPSNFKRDGVRISTQESNLKVSQNQLKFNSSKASAGLMSHKTSK